MDRGQRKSRRDVLGAMAAGAAVLAAPLGAGKALAKGRGVPLPGSIAEAGRLLRSGRVSVTEMTRTYLRGARDNFDTAGIPTRVRQFTVPISYTGFPAISVPCGFNSAGLPVGMQIVADDWEERLLFRIAASVERDSRNVPTTPPIHWDEEIGS